MNPTNPWRGVFFDGPEPDAAFYHPIFGNRYETFAWCVFIGDENVKPVEPVQWVYTYADGLTLARRTAHDRHLDLVRVATTA